MGSVVFKLNLLFTRFIDCLVEYKRKKIENEKMIHLGQPKTPLILRGKVN